MTLQTFDRDAGAHRSKYQIEGNIAYGDRVIFVNAAGEREQAKVSHVWHLSRNGLCPPMINIQDGPTSVPHKSAVPNANAFYYLLEV